MPKNWRDFTHRAIAAWRYVKAHKATTATYSIIAFALGAVGFYRDDLPLLLEFLGKAWQMLTLWNLLAILAFVIWAICALALVIGYYEQRVRVMERDRDCSVLSKLQEELRARLRLAETERDDARVKVVDLQQQVDAQPWAIQQLQAELNEANGNRAHIAMEHLALISRTQGWTVSIVIRFLDYEDRKMADELKEYIQRFEPWPIETKHVPGDIIRPVHESSRMELASTLDSNNDFAGRLVFALGVGKYRRSGLHYVQGESGVSSVVITIFPERKGEHG